MSFVTAQPESLAAAAARPAVAGASKFAANLVAVEYLSAADSARATSVHEQITAGSTWAAAAESVHPLAAS
jgi:hypothetical protein